MASWASLLKLALKWGPQVADVVRQVRRYAEAHPEQADQARKQLERLLSRAGQSRRGGFGSTTREMLDSVRAAADDVDKSETADDQARLETDDWRRRADSIERALRLAEARPGADGKRMLKQVFTRAQALMAEVSAAVVDAQLEEIEEAAAAPDVNHWSLEELHEELSKWEAELRGQGKSPSTVDTYVGRTRTFLRWLAGDYEPRG